MILATNLITKIFFIRSRIYGCLIVKISVHQYFLTSFNHSNIKKHEIILETKVKHATSFHFTFLFVKMFVHLQCIHNYLWILRNFSIHQRVIFGFVFYISKKHDSKHILRSIRYPVCSWSGVTYNV